MSRGQLLRRCMLGLLMGAISGTPLQAQTLTSVILPRYMEGLAPTNVDRVPIAYRLRLSGLLPSRTYRYTNQMVSPTDGSTASGSGNAIFATLSGDFVRSNNVSLANAGNYGTFTTDATGAFEGWFISEPTGNARFTPGSFVLARIALNDGGTGTTVATRLTTSDSVRVVKLSAGATDSTGTGFRGTSFAKQKDFVFTYDNTAGAGRPISGSFIERDGTSNSAGNLYSPFYANNVDDHRGSFGMVLPNLLPTGVRRVERRALATSAVVIAASDADGLWPSGVQTVNPNSGTTPIVIKGSDIKYLTTGLAIDPSFLSSGNVAVQTSKTDTLLAVNTTNSSMTINSIVSSDTSAFAILSSAGPISLSSGNSTKVRIQFHPRVAGSRGARITFTNSGATSPDTIHADGTGVVPATSVIFPRFMEGIVGINNDRVPFACRLRMTKLLASRTYRYYNQFVVSGDQPTADGSGNPIFPLATGFVRAQKVDFDSLGDYGTFTTDATGTYEGWFITESTGSDRFMPGKFAFMRISINDGGAGTTVSTRATTTDSVRIVKLSPGATDSTGTGLRGTSFANAGDFVFTYDNTNGTGRPISGTFIEDDGTKNSASNGYSPFYADAVDGVRGAYGMVLPNLLSTGMLRVERRSLATGAIVTSATDNNGSWPGGAQTVNPNGGTTPIVLKGSDVKYLTTGLALDPSSLSYGNVDVGTSKTDTLLAVNMSGGSMTINSIVSSDTSAFSILSSAGPISLSSGKNTPVRIQFHPRVADTREARITFTNSGPTSPDTLHVDGTGGVDATSVIFPRFMEGIVGINTNRVPFACRLRLTRLLANRTYRYYNQVVVSGDDPEADGAGIPIFPLATGFDRAQKVDFDSTGHYNTFTTDATGAYEGWFITEPTGGARFVPGKFVFMRISMNDGGTGTTVATRATTTDSVRVVKLSVGATDSTGTGLRGTSFANDKDFVFTYDNTNGTGRPISGTFIEDDGTNNSASNSYAPFYADAVDGLRGSFGMVLPNLLSTGVRRVERRALATGAIVTSATDNDGAWPGGAQTVNPNGGTTAIVLKGSDVKYLTTGLALDPSSLSYGDVAVAASKTDTLLAVNTTGSSMTINSIVSSDTSAFAILSSAGPISLSSGASTQVRIQFHPRFAGQREARITFTNSGATSPDTLHVDGNGVAFATSVIFPRFIEGDLGKNPKRVPFACRLRLTKLLANSTYRYYNQVVVSGDQSTDDGAGNPIFPLPTGFTRTQSADVSTPGDYGTFTTDATGAYEGWFVSEPTGGARFVPGKFAFVRINMNDGGTGTTVVTRVTTTDSVRVVKLSVGATDSTGTGLRGTSFAREKDFVFAYDNTNGTGRPISGTFIEDDGTNNSGSNSYASFYADTVDGVRGSFGMVLPNLLSNGVRRVERRSLATGAIVTSATDNDGTWPGGARTVNPGSGSFSIVLKGTDVNYLTTGLALDPSEKSLGYLSVNASRTDSVQAKNTTGSVITINSIVSSDTSAFVVTSSTGPISLGTGATAWIRIVFHPRIAGKLGAHLTFTNSGNTSPDTLHLSGHGLAAATSIQFPRFMEGVVGTNNDRIPFACRLGITSLLPNTTYRYYNQVVTDADTPADDGGGNPIFALPSGFVRTQTVDFSTPGHYATFTTDSTGAYQGWFVVEPTGGGRFLPGKFVFMRINMNDGGTGTNVEARVTSADSVRIVKLATTATDSTGTGLRASSFVPARDFIFAYDNTAGTGRPISGTFVENDGSPNTTTNAYSVFYAASVDTFPGAFGMVLPNLLPNGVRRLDWRDLATGTLSNSITDSDGRWPSGAQTVNPTGGPTAIVIAASDLTNLVVGVDQPAPVERRFMLYQNRPNPGRQTTAIRFSVAESGVATLVIYDVLGRVAATPFNGLAVPGQEYVVTVDGSRLRSGVYWYRLTSGNQKATMKMVLLR